MPVSHKSKTGILVVAENRQARHNFSILEIFEAGVELKGSEVKSIRKGNVQLKEGYAHVRNGELYLEGVHVNPYKFSSHSGLEAVRKRKLLMHKREIVRIHAELSQNRYTLVPLRVYFKDGRAKVELGLAKGKKLYDKRAALKKRETERLVARAQRKFR